MYERRKKVTYTPFDASFFTLLFVRKKVSAELREKPVNEFPSSVLLF